MIGETSDSWGRDIAGWLNSSGLDQLAIYVVAHQKIPRLIQHSSSPIWEFVYPHPDLQNHRIGAGSAESGGPGSDR
ncbi:hypothetical protein AYO43_07215 [Nitrospira sp. SCGC AG-212-E16]|nr:hypothetical protein AYO43_07215 [Nitrospira sp. SCGC AG-212-E16]